MKVYNNINPIYNKESEILILGSMPSKVSRTSEFYYANKTNRFWNIMEDIFKVKLLSKVDKERFLLSNHIALWDVIKSCDIESSKDLTIKNIKYNDIIELIKNTNINRIYCTGKKSYELYKKQFGNKINIPFYCLPSTSSANASMKLNELIDKYKIIL